MTSPLVSLHRGLLAGLLLLSATVALTPEAPPPLVEDEIRLVCIGACAKPTNAAKVFRWGREKWRDEFETPPFPSNWTHLGEGSIGQRNGMLTIRATPTTDELIVWPTGRSATKGRWEARVRAVEFDTVGAQFQFNWELAPADGSNCNASKIIMASYTPGDVRVAGSVRTLPNNAFDFSRARDLRSRAWHTYAIEVTPKRVVWFVDRKVVHRETRPEALSGIAFRPQFVLTGTPDAVMRESWMQMDWVRFYTLKRKHAKPIKQAPPMLQRTYDSGC